MQNTAAAPVMHDLNVGDAARVIRGDDDSSCPMIGLIVGQEDEDRVMVVWGDSIYADHPADEARTEWLDELRPAPGRYV